MSVETSNRGIISDIYQDPLNGSRFEGPIVAPGVEFVTPLERFNHLNSLLDLSKPESRFVAGQLNEAIDQIVAIGYPVDNFNSFNHETNMAEAGTQNHLASWAGKGCKDYGQFTIYDLHHKQINQERLATVGHESAHANSPHEAHNSKFYGGEEGRVAAINYVASVAEQSITTQIWLDGYHRDLASNRECQIAEATEKYKAGTLDKYGLEFYTMNADMIFREETFAIMNEMALTNRSQLENVQQRQHAKIVDINRKNARQNKEIIEPVTLLTTAQRRGATPEGIDAHMIKLLIGINNFDDLKNHIQTLKRKFYPERDAERAETREWSHNTDYVIEQFLQTIGTTALTTTPLEVNPINLLNKGTEDDEDKDTLATSSFRPRPSSLNSHKSDLMTAA